VDQALAAHPAEVARYRGGEQKLMGFFVGQVMKLSGGKADPKGVGALLREKLGG
jgi:Asp-tRNA(Asn)/Glu-tRNA(Gln) amidotransferase B subunit